MKPAMTKPPLCSPSRAAAAPEKFPPPLMRFLRSNGGSKSRGVRSRASPIFYRRTRKSLAAPPTQEPSSPKVTCMGQVRVRRAVKSRHRFSRWLNFKRFLFSCPNFRDQKMWIGNVFKGNWGFCCRSGYCKKVDDGIENSFRIYSNRRRKYVPENDNNVETGALVHSSSSPPRNALILMRCRSAPYRSSSLAGRFFSENEHKSVETQKPTTPETENNRESEDSIEESMRKQTVMHPLLLTRCKSEPARTGERLNPETTIFKRRLEI